MTLTAQQIAEILQGTVVGEPDITVSDLSKIEEGQPGTLTFLANPKYTEYIYTTKASIVLVNDSFTPEKDINATLIKVKDAYKSLGVLLSLVEQDQQKKTGIDPLAFVSKSAKIGKEVYIAPFTYIGDNVIIENNVSILPHCFIGDDVVIDENCTLHSGVRLYNKTKIGKNCIIHAGTVIGSDGFGFAPTEDGSYKKLAQIGNVVLEEDVEIGANCTIDCSTMGSTLLKKGTKLDNMVHIAHNVEIGENTVIAAQSGIAGSTTIGKHCMLGGQVGVSGHLTVAEYSNFGAKTGVTSTIKKSHQTWLGYPYQEITNFRKSNAILRNLPDLRQTVIQLQKEIEELKNKIDNK